ncbi:MAG: DUF1772 domain-containing protein [Saprospiraceae bacterium]|nr:DUF1772 domain-containing protein [Candidatus Vicinibacter affinis]MBP6174321.1 DUF1772 domain-containing protein [Saprospiraceae bacterium]MBK6574277.1 DUF1772 domain-containing protein [Candidatus Vicinibacter affinis]MBK7305535.1 DUF1772 domain-containing protein [Candidatus Vicinibacter affinis]MBK7800913.1 DUF1772 domain-containing protein [Candidatus Vicinibacter affinis]
MITSIFLWSVVLLYSFHFAGHLHNIVANVANWSSGTVEDMNRYSNFFHKGNNTHFFAPVIFASIIACSITLILVWDKNGLTRSLVAVDLIIAIFVLISVVTFFRPMNVYFESKQYESTKLKLLVDKWILFNRIRVVIILGGLIISIWALSSYQSVLK